MTILEQIIDKYLADRQQIKEMKQRHAEELRTLEEFQAKREAALLERGDMTCFSFFVDLYVNGRDGKAEKKKEEENISLNQAKIEAWLLKMLNQVGEGVRTEFGTVYKTRKESVTCQDFEGFCAHVLIPDAAKAVLDYLDPEYLSENEGTTKLSEITNLILNHMHLEMLTKAVKKEAVLELMGEPAKDGSRPNSPPFGVNYTAIQTVGVRKAK